MLEDIRMLVGMASYSHKRAWEEIGDNRELKEKGHEWCEWPWVGGGHLLHL